MPVITILLALTLAVSTSAAKRVLADTCSVTPCAKYVDPTTLPSNEADTTLFARKYNTITTSDTSALARKYNTVLTSDTSVFSRKYNTITTSDTSVFARNYNAAITVAAVDLTGQSGAVSATTIYTPSASGYYRVSAVLKITTTGTSPVAGPITITYTEPDGSVGQSIVMLLHNTSGAVVTTTVNNSTTTGTVNGSLFIYAKTGVAIQYAIAVSGTYGAGRYAAHLKVEKLP